MELGESQVKAITSLKYFLNSTMPAISLVGFAGTGKTTDTPAAHFPAYKPLL